MLPKTKSSERKVIHTALPLPTLPIVHQIQCSYFLQINPYCKKKEKSLTRKIQRKCNGELLKTKRFHEKKVKKQTQKQIRYCQVQLYCAVNVLESVKAVAGMAVEAGDPV